MRTIPLLYKRFLWSRRAITRGVKMNIPDDVKKWLASLDKKQIKQFILFVIARFAEGVINERFSGRWFK